MKSKNLLNAMGKIDDKLIDEALKTASSTAFEEEELDADECYAESVTEIKAVPKRRGIFRWAGLAAGISIVAAGAILLGQSQLFSRLVNSAAPSTDTDISLSTSPDQTNNQLKDETIEDTENVISLSPNPALPKGENDMLANGLPNVPAAKLIPLNEYFDIEDIIDHELNGIYLNFIANGCVYYTEYSMPSEEGLTRLDLICYNLEKEEELIISFESFPDNISVDYELLGVYGDSIFIYRTEYPNTVYNSYINTEIANSMICEISLSDGTQRGLTEVVFDMKDGHSNYVISEQYMFFETISAIDNENESVFYSINCVDLASGSVFAIKENARCPLLYRDELVYYSEGAFWQCDLYGFDDRFLFSCEIDFKNDRLCADKNNIVLARSYEYTENDSLLHAFSIELFDGEVGFVPIALFNEYNLDYQSPIYNAPSIFSADGCFTFLGIIFDPETNAFVEVTPPKGKRFVQVIISDGQLYYYTFNTDWNVTSQNPTIDIGCCRLIRNKHYTTSR